MLAQLELGLIYGLLALGVYITFRVLNFPDLTVDGSFTTGAGTAAILIINGWNPWLATLAAFGTGAIAGYLTALMHTKGKIDGLLAGILSMIGLYSINLRIMGSANLSLLREPTIFDFLDDWGIARSIWSVLILFVAIMVIKIALDWFLHTNMGLAIQATGNNEKMIRSLGANTDRTKTIALMLSNGLVAAGGAGVAQYTSAADIRIGVGMILVGLASVILGQAIILRRTVIFATLAVVLGAVLYRVLFFLAIRIGFDPNDMKLISALLVVAALLLPRWKVFQRAKRRLNRPDPSREGISA